MKFVCDQCKAKYQIADDKVAGKTVKMKCRKCGHLIEVRASVTETSVATAEMEALRRSAAPPPAPRAPLGSVTSPGSSGAAAAGASHGTGTAGTAAPPLAPRAPSAPKPAAARAPLATSLAAIRPQAPKAPATSGAVAIARSEEPAPPSALANAFERSVLDEARAEEPQRDSLAGGDEWYAAINGVPVGPIRLGDLRRKAALGSVTEDSLVWQEGMEEWRPVRSLPDLLDIVREAARIGRPSLLPPDPRFSLSSESLPSAAAAHAMPRVAAPKPPEENTVIMPLKALMPRSSGQSAPAPAAAVAADPFGATPGPPAVRSEPPPAAPVAAAPSPPSVPARRTGLLAPMLMALLAVGFGVVLALVVMNKQQPAPQAAPQPIIIYSSVPAGTASAPTMEFGPNDVASASPAGTTRKPTAAAAKPSASAANSATGGAADLSALLGGRGPAAPHVGGGGPSAGGSSLTTEQVEAVVASRRAGVKRACLDRAEVTTSNVRVEARLTVGGDGRVQSASATGNDPVVARCVENQVRNWTFPATGGTSTLSIPFTLVRQ